MNVLIKISIDSITEFDFCQIRICSMIQTSGQWQTSFRTLVLSTIYFRDTVPSFGLILIFQICSHSSQVQQSCFASLNIRTPKFRQLKPNRLLIAADFKLDCIDH